MALPSPSTAERLLLLLNSISESETYGSKRAKKSSYKLGSLVQAEVHDDNILENPFSSFRVGQTVTARIVGKINQSDNKQKSCQFDLSLKPGVLTC